jgi:hypothetical protein
MRTILAMPFLLLSVLLTILTCYCVVLTFTDDYSYIFVAAGIFLSDMAAITATSILLKS